ncbi:hypothetical protein HAP47_0006565 [Bradyrhizobium sp. 41S5]|uniref:hypothetical protein n=1 Tax=Bradyrhizobium sp. 41S5 TaxID=1404443 RepID=UPI00156B3030|nr:hypothetical protein [Bradyrhizobium sp. 41S5]UFX46350.1 hypothetical protein HAP47_0006565 [Bradyrhizobium sp. 41S5]
MVSITLLAGMICLLIGDACCDVLALPPAHVLTRDMDTALAILTLGSGQRSRWSR